MPELISNPDATVLVVIIYVVVIRVRRFRAGPIDVTFFNRRPRT